MARDETAREPSREASNVSRRNYLRLAGSAAISAAALSTGVSAADDFQTITVPAGEVRSFSLGDGDTLENALIDISADGAGYRISANGDGWAIRNVGVKGYFDANVDDPLVAMCPNGGSGTIENVYLGDGGYDAPAGLTTGIFVHAYHTGHIDIDRVNIQGWAGNGVYASGPGNHDDHPNPGGGGTVQITNSYAADNPTADFRLGTDGSYCKNCVSKGAGRGYWGFYNTTKLIDCDIHNGIYASDGSWQSPAVVQLENTRFSGGTHTYVDSASISGSSAGTPRYRIPNGVPTTAKEAASGATSTGDSSDSTTTSPDDSNAAGTVLELVAGSSTSNTTYEFTVEGSVQKRTSSGDVAAEDNDTVTSNGDGTVTVSGLSGNGYGDSFLVDGDIVSMNLDESKWTLKYGGNEVSVNDLVLPNKLVIDGSNAPRRSSEYTVEFSGTARKSAALGSVNDHDTITDGKISGRVIGGKDGYRFSGEITGFRLDGPANVRVEDGS
ncbi:hypothetical protein M0R89_14815 [Halorussus limi]|uniref:Uncharacterized protein n=1 Tax=Halorussus limi TaxID=2938695 RepID=A0A8U0HT01_9EURY|nr:hypothetical protein [Halorussus limi]UPV73804.1 hypothetical protein M0R89_14815 [Halorussus limi]